MKQLVQKTGFMLVVLCGVGFIGWGTMADGGYSAEGMAVLEQAHTANRAKMGRLSWSEVFDHPRPPAQVLLAMSGAWGSEPSDQLVGATVAGTLALALAIGLVGLAAWRLGGVWMGTVAAALMLFAPGTLFYARTFGPESVITLSTAFLLWVSTHQRDTVRHGILVTAAFLLAMASSHDGLLLLIPWAAAAFTLSWRTTDESPGSGRIVLGAVSPATLVPLIAAPLLLFWLWPYLHTQGGARWIQVLTEPFRLSHPPVLVGGSVFDSVTHGTAPGVVAGLVSVLGRFPVAILVLTVLGSIRVIRAIRLGNAQARASFAVLGLLTLVGIASLNGGAFYAGTDGLLPMWPFVALLASVAIRDLSVACASMASAQHRHLRRIIFWGMALACVGPTIMAFMSSYPMETHYKNGALRLADDEPGVSTQLNPAVYVPRRTVAWLNHHMSTHDVRLGSAVANHRFRPLLTRLIRFEQLPSGFDTVESYDATHLWVPYLPAEPLYSDVQAQWNDPLYEYVHRGTPYGSLHSR